MSAVWSRPHHLSYEGLFIIHCRPRGERVDHESFHLPDSGGAKDSRVGVGGWLSPLPARVTFRRFMGTSTPLAGRAVLPRADWDRREREDEDEQRT